MNFKTPNDFFNFQAQTAKAVLAYVPDVEIRDRLTALVDANVLLALSFANASTVYGETMKAKVFAK